MFTSNFLVLTLSAAALVCGVADNGLPRIPGLLEVFTSEGCSSCPPADRLLEIPEEKRPASGIELIVLSEHVDYWDRFGWKDPFSSPQYTARQQDDTNRYNFDGMYARQLVVDGRYGFFGSDGHEASAAIQKVIQERKASIAISMVARNGNQTTAGIELPAGQNVKGVRGNLHFVLADNRRESHATRGENAGRSLAHVASRGPLDM